LFKIQISHAWGYKGDESLHRSTQSKMINYIPRVIDPFTVNKDFHLNKNKDVFNHYFNRNIVQIMYSQIKIHII